MKRIYIRGSASISPQDTFLKNELPDRLLLSTENRLICQEPASYAQVIPPARARRMSRILKMGLASALQCLENSGLAQPDAIITGTALGCLEDTEKFLVAMIRDQELFLTPTHFIQSTQNSVAAQIAMHLQCKHHNFTFVHKGFSFESAMLDGMMLLRDNEAKNVLVGGLDEMTDRNYALYVQLGLIRKEPVQAAHILQHPGTGTIAGEGSTFFTLTTEKPVGRWIELVDIQTHFGALDPVEMTDLITSLLDRHEWTPDDLSFCMLGLNGDESHDRSYSQWMEKSMSNVPQIWYKHLCGEYQTSSAFALWLATRLLLENRIPNYLKLNPLEPRHMERVLITTHYDNNFAFYVLELSPENKKD